MSSMSAFFTVPRAAEAPSRDRHSTSLISASPRHRGPSTLNHVPVLLVLAIVAWLPVVTFAQTEPTLRFISPTADTYLSGPVLLRVAIEPPTMIREVIDVTFYADGRQICVADGARPECAWDAGPNVEEHLIRAVARLRNGSRIVQNVRTKGLGYAEAVTVEIVQVNAVVTDGSGHFVQGLTRDQFVLLEDGKPRPLTSFHPTGTALELVLAVDVSGSMADAMNDVKQAVGTFMEALGPKDQATLVAFNDAMFTLARRESNPAVRKRAVSRLSAWGGTALYDVIVRSLDMLSRHPGRRALVIFSDGDDQASQASFADVERLVREGDATLFMVGLGRGATNDELKRKMEQLALASGGRALFVERSDQLAEPFAAIVEELSNQYMLGFEPRQDGKWHTIDVQVPNTRYRVRARQGYKAPAGSTR
jgi:Ca-activated chloride channel family protein